MFLFMFMAISYLFVGFCMAIGYSYFQAKIKRCRTDDGIFLILVLLWPIGAIMVMGMELPDIIYNTVMKKREGARCLKSY